MTASTGVGRGGARRGSGRPPGSKTNRSLDKVAQRYGRKAIKELWEIAQGSDSDIARVQAIREILDRGYGKTAQPHKHGGMDGGSIPFTFDMGGGQDSNDQSG